MIDFCRSSRTSEAADLVTWRWGESRSAAPTSSIESLRCLNLLSQPEVAHAFPDHSKALRLLGVDSRVSLREGLGHLRTSTLTMGSRPPGKKVSLGY